MSSNPANRQHTSTHVVFPMPGGPEINAARLLSLDFFASAVESTLSKETQENTAGMDRIPMEKPVVQISNGVLIAYDVFKCTRSVFCCQKRFIHKTDFRCSFRTRNLLCCMVLLFFIGQFCFDGVCLFHARFRFDGLLLFTEVLFLYRLCCWYLLYQTSLLTIGCTCFL